MIHHLIRFYIGFLTMMAVILSSDLDFMNNNFPRLLVGLGNPDRKYESTRHNVGFMVINELVKKFGSSFGKKQHIASSEVITIRLSGRKVILQKPLTFMNCSGSAVAKIKTARKLQLSELLIIYDDVDLPLGKIRIRQNGGSGGHRGMESIISELGSKNFSRLRFGIGRSNEQESVPDYVLSPFEEDEIPIVTKMLKVAIEAIALSVRCGTTVSMNKYNSVNLAENNIDGKIWSKSFEEI